jgi:hypothetical protein
MNMKKFRHGVAMPKPAMQPKPQKLDANLILGQLAAIRKRIPYLEEGAPPRPAEDVRTRSTDGLPLQTAEDFEWAAVIDGFESLADDISAIAAQKRAEVLEKALRIYYATEELSRDPEHADLMGQVEKMRAAYERDFGKPIPPKGEK